MAELIDKRVLLESLEQTEKEFENVMTYPSWWNALRIIEEQQAVAKEDIRAAAIDEFAETAKGICATHGLGTDRKLYIPLYVHEDGTWHDLIGDVAEQLKGKGGA